MNRFSTSSMSQPTNRCQIDPNPFRQSSSGIHHRARRRKQPDVFYRFAGHLLRLVCRFVLISFMHYDFGNGSCGCCWGPLLEFRCCGCIIDRQKPEHITQKTPKANRFKWSDRRFVAVCVFEIRGELMDVGRVNGMATTRQRHFESIWRRSGKLFEAPFCDRSRSVLN